MALAVNLTLTDQQQATVTRELSLSPRAGVTTATDFVAWVVDQHLDAIAEKQKAVDRRNFLDDLTGMTVGDLARVKRLIDAIKGRP